MTLLRSWKMLGRVVSIIIKRQIGMVLMSGMKKRMKSGNIFFGCKTFAIRSDLCDNTQTLFYQISDASSLWSMGFEGITCLIRDACNSAVPILSLAISK